MDEVIWVKTNQLQRIIRTGRTGHWLNHGKEHCLVNNLGCRNWNRIVMYMLADKTDHRKNLVFINQTVLGKTSCFHIN